MHVPGVIYASQELLSQALSDNAPAQIINVACLPGILRYSLAMPDVHWGYGAPIGGVAAFDAQEGVIVPGIVGYDCNCGVRLLRTNLRATDIEGKTKKLVNALFGAVPSGVGSSGTLTLQQKDLENVVRRGARWAVDNGYGTAADLEKIEEGGCIEASDPAAISTRACERGTGQLGTLGSGNHFLEIQRVTDIYDPPAADAFGLFVGQVTFMIHTGSRGFGYQVCDDYLAVFGQVPARYGISLPPDRQLACAPASSPEGRRYFAAMNGTANYAFANRQVITHLTRETTRRVLGISSDALGAATVYDVAHNICKREEHEFNGSRVSLHVHRKGATRAFPAGHSALPDVYRNVGQPVIIPGTMGTASYVLVGTRKAMEETWGSTCHGAGRMMSRKRAVRENRGRSIFKELARQGVSVAAKSKRSLAEEMPAAYKDVDEVIRTVEGAGISRKVARMTPLAVMKG